MLFGKKDIKKLEDALTKAQEKQDFAGIAKYYYEIGKFHKEEKNIVKALYFLTCFDDLVGGNDSLYDKFSKKDNQVMDWIIDLEMDQDEPIFAKRIQNQVLEKSGNLNNTQKLQWVLLTMSRFSTLFQQIAKLPEFEGFDRLGDMVTYFCAGLYEETDEEMDDAIADFGEMLDDVFDSILMSDFTQKVELANQNYFVPADLGNDEEFWFSMVYAALETFVAEGKEEELDMEFVACGIIPNYYYRTMDLKGMDDIADEKKVKEEVERIFSDYDFILEEPSKEEFKEKLEHYKKVMLL